MSAAQPRLKFIAAAAAMFALALLIAAAAPVQMSPPPHSTPPPDPHPAAKPAQHPSPPVKPATSPTMPSNMGPTPAELELLRLGQLHPNYSFPTYMMPYEMGTSGAYGGRMPMSYGGYGGGYGGGSASHVAGTQQERGEAGPEQPSTEVRTISRILSAAGLPNDGGRLSWPVGLRILPNPRTADLRQQIGALLEEAAQQSAAGPGNARLNHELASAVDSLRKVLLRDREERCSLPYGTYEDAEIFLTKLKHAQELLSGGLESPGGKAQLKTQKNTAEVGIYDNRFDPLALNLSVGTTVRWTNHGEHKHTVTADKGDWTSKELAPGAAYSYTFSKPGTYTYHCEIHSTEMRGSVVVK